MAKNEKTSSAVGKIAAVGIKTPGKLSHREVQKVCASNLSQRPDRKPVKKK
jgi:hypothetical protein